MTNKLLILNCSEAKRETEKPLPALEVYDGPYYRVLRKYLREYQWPENVSISTLSAKHGLIGVITDIRTYNMRMNRKQAEAKAQDCSRVLHKWASDHSSAHVAVGNEYAPAIAPALQCSGLDTEHFRGAIGLKQSQVKAFLHGQPAKRRERAVPERRPGPLRYFLPDWDDLLDPGFDFENDEFSGSDRTMRGDLHCNSLMQPAPMCDGILVSLAQHQTSKGPLRKLEGTESASLAPIRLREFYGLRGGQMLFGDCGAFSYVNEETPSISTDQAIALYDLYNFDMGASVDHIPFAVFSEEERQRRVEISCQNAEEFINAWASRGKPFTPVGSIQGVSAEQYAENVQKYYEMGYRHLAIGGMVPLKDQAVLEIVRAISETANRLPQQPWIHLFGIYRPKLQPEFRALGVDSFDSASYFRKAWLRSDQNYYSADGQWYAAIRVPMTKDPRTRKKLTQTMADTTGLEDQEKSVLRLLNQYGKGTVGVDDVLDAVLAYDERLHRSSEISSMRDKYRRTLEDKPWLKCRCTFCSELGIHILIFRGGNRNKRRGAHNTAMLYGGLAVS